MSTAETLATPFRLGAALALLSLLSVGWAGTRQHERPAGAERPADDPRPRDFSPAPLWGIERAALAMSVGPGVETELGLSAQRIRQEVVAYFRGAGLELVDVSEIDGVPGGTAVYLMINGGVIEGGNDYAYNVALAVKQMVVPVQNPDVTTHAMIWHTSRLGLGRGDWDEMSRNFWSALERTCRELLDAKAAEDAKRAPSDD